jgi:hypothetical protein
MVGGGHAVCADGLHAASLPKQVSAAELRACLHVSSAHPPCKCLVRLRFPQRRGEQRALARGLGLRL